MIDKEADERRIQQIPVVGYVDKGLREHGPFGVLMVVGLFYLGAALGAFMVEMGWEPILYGAVWMFIGITLVGYALWDAIVKVDERYV